MHYQYLEALSCSATRKHYKHINTGMWTQLLKVSAEPRLPNVDSASSGQPELLNQAVVNQDDG